MQTNDFLDLQTVSNKYEQRNAVYPVGFKGFFSQPEYRKIHLQTVHDRLHGGRSIEVYTDPHHFQTACTVFGVKSVQVRELFDAGCTPGRHEDQ